MPYQDGLPFESGSETSQAAAESMVGPADKARMAVLHFIEACGLDGATNDEIEMKTGMSGNTIRPRRRELEDAWLVVKTSTQRPTRSGRLADVYVAASVVRAQEESAEYG